VPRPAEPLWELRRDYVTWRCDLSYHGEDGVEAQILRDGALVIGRRFDLKEQAVQWGEEERKLLTKGGA
jgi:hypothetical protein